MVATEVGDSKDQAEWKAKKIFYEKIMHHKKAYENFLNTANPGDDEVEFEDNKTAGSKRKRKSLPQFKEQ